jgi:hypothetical protein
MYVLHAKERRDKNNTDDKKKFYPRHILLWLRACTCNKSDAALCFLSVHYVFTKGYLSISTLTLNTAVKCVKKIKSSSAQTTKQNLILT